MYRAIAQVLGFSVLCCGASNGAEPVALSDPYYDEIFLGLGIDPDNREVWASGSQYSVTDENTTEIAAYYKRPPRRYDDNLCIVEVHRRGAEVTDDTVIWRAKRTNYNVWLAPTLGCESTPPYSEPPHVRVLPDLAFDSEAYLQPNAVLEPEVDLEEVKFILKNEAAIFADFQALLTPEGVEWWGWTTHRLRCIYRTTFEISTIGKGPFVTLYFESPAGSDSGPIVHIQFGDEEALIRGFGGGHGLCRR